MSSLCARVRSAQGPVAGRSSVRPWTSVRTQPCRRTSALRAVEQRDGPTTAAGAASGSTTSGSRRSSSPESSAAISSQSSGSQSSGSAEERRYMSLLPPFVSRATRLEELGEGLWALVQPLKLDWDAFDIQIRMTVARLPDGSLLLASPVAPTPECLRLLASLGGAVRHIVLPSAAPEHWWFAPQLSAAFPEATVWCVPGFLENKGTIPFTSLLVSGMRPRCKTLGVDPLPAELEGQLEWDLLTAPFFIEAALVLPAHRALLLADTGFCLAADDYSHLGAKMVDGAKQALVWDRLGPITKIVFDRYPERGRAWLAAVRARSWEMVVPAHASVRLHGRPLGRADFDGCFSFLL